MHQGRACVWHRCARMSAADMLSTQAPPGGLTLPVIVDLVCRAGAMDAVKNEIEKVNAEVEDVQRRITEEGDQARETRLEEKAPGGNGGAAPSRCVAMVCSSAAAASSCVDRHCVLFQLSWYGVSSAHAGSCRPHCGFRSVGACLCHACS